MNRKILVMSPEGAAGATGGAPPAAGGAPAAGTPPAGGTTPPSWYGGFSEENRGYVEAKGFKDSEAVVHSYRGLEKLLGAPKERILHLPDKEDDPAWQGIHARLGRPEKADGYDVKFDPQVGNEDFVKWSREMFHGLGLSKKQGEAIAKQWNERGLKALQDAQAEAVDASEKQHAALKKEWGLAFESKSAAINKVCQAAGLSSDQAKQVEQVLGIDVFAKFMDNIVSKFGITTDEAKFRGVTGEGGNNFGALTPAGAAEKKKLLLADREYANRYLSGSLKERQEIEALEKMIFAGRQVG